MVMSAPGLAPAQNTRSGAVAPVNGDVLAERLYAAFMLEVSDRRGKTYSDEEVTAWRRDWLGRLVQALPAVEDPGWKRSLATAALGMANGVEDFDQAERMLELLADISDSPEQSAEWMAELGGLRQRAAVARGTEAEGFESARKTFDQAIVKLLQTEAGRNLSPAGFNRLIRTLMDVGGSAIKEAQAKNMKCEACLVDALGYYKRGRDTLTVLEKLAREDRTPAPDTDHHEPGSYLAVFEELKRSNIDGQAFAILELSVCAALKNDDRAIDVLKYLAGVSDLRQDLSNHVIAYSREAYRASTDSYCQFLLRWINETPLSHEQLKVRSSLSTTFLLRKMYQEAAETASPVFDDADATRLLSSKEAMSFVERSGGTTADAMVVAAQAHHALGHRPETLNLADRFIKLFDRDPRADYMASLLSVPIVREVPPAQRSTFWVIILNAIAVTIVLGWIVVARRRVAASVNAPK
jgi:hypothetical protein